MPKKKAKREEKKISENIPSNISKSKDTSIDPKEKKSLVYEIVKTVLTIAFIFVGVRYFLIQPFLVVGSSMEPNFHEGQYLFVNELGYRLTAPKRGDVVVFKHPDENCTRHIESSFLNRIFFQGPCKNYIKRIVGLPSERVTIEEGKVKIVNTETPEGFTLDESTYVPSNVKLYGSQTVTLGKKEYYVLGDNREPNGSSDSREWGALPRNHITGKVWITVFPLSELGFLPKVEY